MDRGFTGEKRGCAIIAAMESSFNRRADELIIDGRYADAQALLDAFSRRK
jgi:hypothetical protein